MTAPGQFLERPAVIDAGGLALEGLFHRGGRRPALLLCPAPGPGGGMDAPLLAELAWAAARAGHPSLRFQHRGVGGSQGEPDPARALDDALAAWAHLAASVPGPIAVAAAAGGCGTAVALASARPAAALALVAPAGPLELAGGPAPLVVLPEQGGGAPPAGAARVEVVAGADPAFRAGLVQVGRLVVGWLAARR